MAATLTILVLCGFLTSGLAQTTDIPINIEDACHIKIQICGGGLSETDTMYFEINNNRIVTNECDDQHIEPTDEPMYYFFALTRSCRVITYMYAYVDEGGFEIEDWMDHIYDTLHWTPYGGYFIMISRTEFIHDIIIGSNKTRTYQAVMKEFGFDWEDYTVDAELYSVDDVDREGATLFNDTAGDPALAVVYRKTIADLKLLKTIKPDSGPRMIDLKFDDIDYCLEPLSPLDRVMHDPSIYGVNDQLIDSSSPKLHVDFGNIIGCSGTVYGWEFIPANDETNIEVFVGSTSGSSAYTVIGQHSLDLQSSDITDDLDINYACKRQNPIYNVEPGNWYGYSTADYTTSIAAPLKVLYPVELTSVKYPCAKQFTWGDASAILKFDVSSSSGLVFSDSDWDTTWYGAMALRPIMEPEFIYMCDCNEDNDCQEFHDFNMVCQNSACTCRDGYIYSRKHNRCLYAELTHNATNVYQSTTLDDLYYEWEAERAVDENTEARILNGTCAMTEKGADPWFIVDLGMEVDVYAVEITTPIPLDAYLVGWESITNPPPNPVPDPDCFLHDDDYPSLKNSSHCEKDTLERIDVHGPFPWKIETEDVSDREILNREYRDGVRTYYHTNSKGSNMGSVGINTQIVSRIINFGYMHTAGDASCWEESGGKIVQQVKDISEECLNGSVVYVEQTEGDTDDYYFRRLSDDYSLKLDSFAPGSKVTFGSDSTSFQIHDGGVGGISDLLTAAVIRPTNDLTKCLQFDSEVVPQLELGTNCVTFRLQKIFDETIPLYNYRQEDYNSTIFGTAPYQEIDVTSDQELRPCYEIFKSKDTDGGSVTYVKGNTDINLVAYDRLTNTGFDHSDPLIFRSNIVGVRDFIVAVGNTFNPDTFDVDYFDNYTICNSFEGSPLNGKPFTVECKTPIHGRYVGLYLDTSSNLDKIQLCNIEVHTLKGAVHDSFCESNSDCEIFRDDAPGDQHLVCVKENVEDVHGLCQCDAGYVYHRQAQMCVDVDECKDPLVTNDPTGVPKCSLTIGSPEGSINGTCVNLMGSYTCECAEGFTYVITETGPDNGQHGECQDIDETLDENCGCEYNCTNGNEMLDGYFFLCSCPPGFRLNSNGLGCEDIDECSYGGELEGNFCLAGDSVTIVELEEPWHCLRDCAMDPDCLATVVVNENECFVLSQCGTTVSSNAISTFFRKNIGLEFENNKTVTCLMYYNSDILNGLYTADAVPPPVGCMNTLGSYECVCQEGYAYIEGKCTNIDECPGLCEGQCTDQEPWVDGGDLYVCDCGNLDGYELGPDGYSCIDTDECEIANDCNSSGNPSADTYQNEPTLQCSMCGLLYPPDASCGCYGIHVGTLPPLPPLCDGTTRYNAWCRNTIASYHCECPPGYDYLEVEKWCEDIDECSSPLRIHECEDQCFNLPGSYECGCDNGYTISLNNHSCEDVVECVEQPNICNSQVDNFPSIIDGICVNNIGSYTCVCDPGYEWDNINCRDIDECLEDKPCEDHCENRYTAESNMMYECFCNDPGYKLSNNSHTCIDIDECETEDHLCVPDGNATCVNTIGSYHCLCAPGYIWNESWNSCHDVNECDKNNGMCSDQCNNTVGSYECSCFLGFELTSNDHVCEDVNECTRGLDTCSDLCENQEGSYACHCYEGRRLLMDRKLCTDIDECSYDNGGCDHNCTNMITVEQSDGPILGVTCSCYTGYRLLEDHRGCVDIDECLQPEDNACAEVCHNTVGSYECACNEGHKLNENGRTCSDVNECLEQDNGGCMMNCTNSNGSFLCSCVSGYKLDGNRRTCTDIDECSDENGDCQQICINTPGSYLCACDGHYILLHDGFKCSGFNAIELRSKLNLPYIEEYSDTSSPEFKSLKQWLELNFNNLCGDVQLISRGITRCEIMGPFFPTTEINPLLEALQISDTWPRSVGRSRTEAGRELQPDDQDETGAPDQIVPSAVRSHMANLAAERRGSETADRVHFPAFEGSIVGFDVVIRSNDIINEQKRGELSSIVSKLLEQNDNAVVINKTEVQLVDVPLFINVKDDGSENLFRSPCDYFLETNYCMNGATCEVVSDSPVCRCVDDYTGSRCDVKPSTKLKTKDIAIFSGLIGIGLLCIFLTIGVCYSLLRKSEQPSLHRGPDVQFGSQPSMIWRSAYGDYFK